MRKLALRHNFLAIECDIGRNLHRDSMGSSSQLELPAHPPYQNGFSKSKIKMSSETQFNSIARRQAAVAVISQHDKLLTITRSQTVRAPGEVCFPGGGVEPGETIAEALIREMQEELNIFVEPVGAVWQSTGASGVELNWWKTEIVTGQEIRPNPEEVHSFQWMTISEITRLPNLLASNLEFFNALGRGDFRLP